MQTAFAWFLLLGVVWAMFIYEPPKDRNGNSNSHFDKKTKCGTIESIIGKNVTFKDGDTGRVEFIGNVKEGDFACITTYRR